MLAYPCSPENTNVMMEWVSTGLVPTSRKGDRALYSQHMQAHLFNEVEVATKL